MIILLSIWPWMVHGNWGLWLEGNRRRGDIACLVAHLATYIMLEYLKLFFF